MHLIYIGMYMYNKHIYIRMHYTHIHLTKLTIFSKCDINASEVSLALTVSGPHPFQCII